MNHILLTEESNFKKNIYSEVKVNNSQCIILGGGGGVTILYWPEWLCATK